MDKPISIVDIVIMNVAAEIIVPNIPKSLFLEFENKEVTPEDIPTKFMKNCNNAIDPTTSSWASVIAVTHTNKKNIDPKIENIKEVILKPE